MEGDRLLRLHGLALAGPECPRHPRPGQHVYPVSGPPTHGMVSARGHGPRCHRRGLCRHRHRDGCAESARHSNFAGRSTRRLHQAGLAIERREIYGRAKPAKPADLGRAEARAPGDASDIRVRPKMTAMADFILALDQGTTSSRAILFDRSGIPVASAQREVPQIYPQAGWVEHDPETLWSTTLSAGREALKLSGVSATDVAAIGIANQRETTLLWDRKTGIPIYPAIVWQDRRTAEKCEELRDLETTYSTRTGLLMDPYFSGTKIAWILENVRGAASRAERGQLAFGTVDSYLVWRLTGGRSHVTDIT